MCNESHVYVPLDDILSSSEYTVFRATMFIKVINSKYTVILVHTTKASEAGGMTPCNTNLGSS